MFNLPHAHKKRDGVRGGGRWAKRIWLMRSASLYIHDYFLESIRETWLIQTVSLIGVLAISAVDFPLSLSYFYGDLIFVLPVSSPAASLNRHRSSFIPGALLIDWMWQIMSIQLHLSSVLWLRWQSRIWLLVIRQWEFLPSHQNVLMSSDGISNFFLGVHRIPRISTIKLDSLKRFAHRIVQFAAASTKHTEQGSEIVLSCVKYSSTELTNERIVSGSDSVQHIQPKDSERSVCHNLNDPWSLKTVKRWVSTGSLQRFLILLTPRLQPDRQWP